MRNWPIVHVSYACMHGITIIRIIWPESLETRMRHGLHTQCTIHNEQCMHAGSNYNNFEQ